MINYGFKKQIDMSYEKALEFVPEQLKKEGFGVLTEIDVRETLREKMDVEFPKYRILGACNPPFAHQSLLTEMDIGLMLPCNVIIYERDGKTFLSIIKPGAAMSVIDNPALSDIAGEVEARLRRVFDSIN